MWEPRKPDIQHFRLATYSTSRGVTHTNPSGTIYLSPLAAQCTPAQFATWMSTALTCINQHGQPTLLRTRGASGCVSVKMFGLKNTLRAPNAS